MIKLDIPTNAQESVIDACNKGITGDPALIKLISTEKHLLISKVSQYTMNAEREELYTIQPTIALGDDSVLGRLTKSNLITLYDSYFRGKKKPARTIYDSIIAAAKEMCPFCSIGRPKTLDHYLPKGEYPQFSILPVNLIPACRDCNLGDKGTRVAAEKGTQLLQPYLDKPRYFSEQWISARLHGARYDSPNIEYFVDPPANWQEYEKNRVASHFSAFNIADKFSIEAGPRLNTYCEQMKRVTFQGVSFTLAKQCILQSAIENAPFVNNWERILCLALMGKDKAFFYL